MQPGMPQGFGLLGDGQTPIFTLPGNPVSAFVSFCSSCGRRCALQGGSPAGACRAVRGRYGGRAALARGQAVVPARRAGVRGRPSVEAR